MSATPEAGQPARASPFSSSASQKYRACYATVLGLFDVLLRMVKEWGEEDVALLNPFCIDSFYHQKDPMKLKTLTAKMK